MCRIKNDKRYTLLKTDETRVVIEEPYRIVLQNNEKDLDLIINVKIKTDGTNQTHGEILPTGDNSCDILVYNTPKDRAISLSEPQELAEMDNGEKLYVYYEISPIEGYVNTRLVTIDFGVK